MFSCLTFTDFHCLGKLAFAQSRHSDREHRGGLPEWSQTHAVAGGHFRRDSRQARPRQDEVPQNRQRQQSPRLHRQQRSQTRFHRR